MQNMPYLSIEQKQKWETYSYEILDTSYEGEFNDIIQLASQICVVPISVISLAEKGRQWFNEMPRLKATEPLKKYSLCGLTLSQNKELFEIKDASQDYRFYDNPLVAEEPNIRFYAGVPLINKHGHKLGTLCVVNTVPQSLDEEQSFALKALAKQVLKLLDLRLCNKELIKQKAQLSQQADMHNRIISIIAHDVRSPVAGLKQILLFINNRKLSQIESKKLLAMAEKELDATLDLLSDLLSWGKMQLSAQYAQYETINLNTIISDNLIALQSSASLKNNQLKNLVANDFVINSDKNALSFIIRNLLTNANKFTGNGTISINATKENGIVYISISDTGVGISDDTKQELFNKRAIYSSVGTNKEKGNGIGLLFTKDFVDMLGGTITIDSNLKTGTTFNIELPELS